MNWLIPLLAAVALSAPQARPATNPMKTGTAVLSGTVVADEPNGQPLRRVYIAVTLINDPRQQYVTSTDERGRFSIDRLPATSVRLVASKPAYVTTHYGARQSGSTVGLPISLVDGQTTTVAVRMPRGAVITGTVSDENGQPMTGVGIRVQRVTVSALGQRVFTPTTGALIPTTDDRGGFRMFGLPAGDYVVMAQPRVTGASEIRPTTAEELQWADRQIKGAGGAAGGTLASENSPVRAQTITYASVFFPGTVTAANAALITLSAGQERVGVDLRMQFVPTARVEGTVTTADGQPARGVTVMLIPEDDGSGSSTQAAERLITMMDIGLVGTTAGTTAVDGSFSLQSIEPGRYTLIAQMRNVAAVRALGAAEGLGPEMAWAMTDVRIDGRDIMGVALRLAPAQRASGQLVFESKTPPSTALRAAVTLRALSTRGITVNAPADTTFVITGIIPAAYRVAATVTNWTLRSAMLGGRDVADVPLDIKPGEDVTGLVLTFTDTPAEVSGVLYDPMNRPSSDLSIVLFSADRAMWFAGSRRVRPSVRPANDGRFTFSGLVAGEYYLAALTDVSPADLANPAFLEQVVPAAIKLTVAHGEKKTQDLRIR